MLKRGTLPWTIVSALEAVLLVVLGILFIVWSGDNGFQETAIRIAGILVIIGSSIRLLLETIKLMATREATVIKDSMARSLAGAAELAFGIALCYVANHYEPTIVDGVAVSGGKSIFGYFGIYLGVLLIVVSSILILNTIIGFAKKMNTLSQGIFQLILGGLILALGILCLFNLNPTKGENVVQFFLIALGIMSIISGLSIASMCIYINVKKKKEPEAVLDQPQDESSNNEADKPSSDEEESKSSEETIDKEADK